MVIILNGTGSSGKSTISKELLKIIPEPTVYHSFDTIIPTLLPHSDSFIPAMDPKKKNYIRRLDSELMKNISNNGKSLLPLVYEFIPILSNGGFNVIVDTLLPNKCIEPLLKIINNIPTYMIKIYCPKNELLKREQKRNDRKPGAALKMYNKVHEDLIYDFEIDSSLSSSKSSAEEIWKYIESNKPNAFLTMKKQL